MGATWDTPGEAAEPADAYTRLHVWPASPATLDSERSINDGQNGAVHPTLRCYREHGQWVLLLPPGVLSGRQALLSSSLLVDPLFAMSGASEIQKWKEDG